jgi:peptidyl-prolyl cis-trans isomerase SurA
METITFLKDLKSKIESNTISFEEAAKQYSQDVSTNLKGGYMGFIMLERLDSLTLEAVKVLDTGKISNPLKTSDDRNYGYEIIKVLKKVPTHTATMEKDYDRIKKLATMFKENTEMEKWIEELKKSVYVDVKY